jgi:hypothetical protein
MSAREMDAIDIDAGEFGRLLDALGRRLKQRNQVVVLTLHVRGDVLDIAHRGCAEWAVHGSALCLCGLGLRLGLHRSDDGFTGENAWVLQVATGDPSDRGVVGTASLGDAFPAPRALEPLQLGNHGF